MVACVYEQSLYLQINPIKKEMDGGKSRKIGGKLVKWVRFAVSGVRYEVLV